MLSIRNASIKDRDVIFEWRNDALSRSMFKNSGLVTWERHCEWFANALSSSEICVLICEREHGEPICVVRFDVNVTQASVSINLSPTARGQGLGRVCLDLAMHHFKSRRPFISTFYAEIKTSNVASLRMFERIGFKRLGEQSGFWNLMAKM